jgi:xylulokinase
LKTERPDVFARTAKYISFQEFILWRLTGRPVVDYSIASRTMLFDVSRKAWIGEFLQGMGIDERFLSPACLGTQPAGPLLAAAAQKMGLAPGTLVVPGAHDQSCAALGVGVVREGVASDGTGSFEAIATVSRKPFTSPELLARGTGSQCHVTPDTYLPLAFHNAAGSLVRWYRDQLGAWEVEQAQKQGVDAYELITAAARRSPPGANGLLVLPHWNGAGTGRIPPLDPGSRGAIFGLTLAHTRDDLSRAVFEGITLETRYLLDSFESAGIRIDSLAVTGGGAKSPFWLQLKADVTGKVIRVPRVTEASLLGAAILAGVGAGIYSGVEEAVDRVCRVEGEYHPDPAAARVYDRLFPLYQDVYAAALVTSKRLAGFAAGA